MGLGGGATSFYIYSRTLSDTQTREKVTESFVCAAVLEESNFAIPITSHSKLEMAGVWTCSERQKW